MNKNLAFRIWFYFRIGWTTYFALFFAGVNTATITYFLAIERVPFLLIIFPTFFHYIILVSSVLLPFLILVGWTHYRKSAAYSSEAAVMTENNPYMYKIPPGWNREVLFPILLKMTKFMITSSNNEKFDDKNIEELDELQKKLDTLLKGGKVGKSGKMEK
mgnify:CR=1 FL=1